LFDARNLLAEYKITWDPRGPLSACEADGASLNQEHTIEVLRLQRLYTEQSHLSSEVLNHYRARDLSETFPGSYHADQFDIETGHRPTVMSYRGKLWLIDGNHRAVVSRERSESFFTAWHVDRERDRREYEQWVKRRQQLPRAGAPGNLTRIPPEAAAAAAAGSRPTRPSPSTSRARRPASPIAAAARLRIASPTRQAGPRGLR
jgi:hypothetical protein